MSINNKSESMLFYGFCTKPSAPAILKSFTFSYTIRGSSSSCVDFLIFTDSTLLPGYKFVVSVYGDERNLNFPAFSEILRQEKDDHTASFGYSRLRCSQWLRKKLEKLFEISPRFCYDIFIFYAHIRQLAALHRAQQFYNIKKGDLLWLS